MTLDKLSFSFHHLPMMKFLPAIPAWRWWVSGHLSFWSFIYQRFIRTQHALDILQTVISNVSYNVIQCQTLHGCNNVISLFQFCTSHIFSTTFVVYKCKISLGFTIYLLISHFIFLFCNKSNWPHFIKSQSHYILYLINIEYYKGLLSFSEKHNFYTE